MKSILAICMLSMHIFCFASTVSTNLTVEYKNGQRTVSLKWQNPNSGISNFVLQRSSDNRNWKDIYSLRAAQFSKTKLEKFSDQNPEPVNNYYRLKIVFDNNTAEYSASTMVMIGNTLNSWNMYPVPVRDVLNLQYMGSESIRGVVSVFIQNMSGYVFTRKRFSSLGRIFQVPVDNLGKGTYDIRIVINDEIVWNQRFVK